MKSNVSHMLSAIVASILIYIPQVYSAQSLTNLYIKNLQNESNWALTVKDSFSKENIKKTCGSYAPGEYPNCYLKFVNVVTQKQKLTTTGIILLQAVGIMVSMNNSNDSRNPAQLTDKSQMNLKKALDVSEIVLTLLEKDQYFRKSQTFSPPGPEADALALVANSVDDKFQIEVLGKTQEMLTKSASTSCLINNSCPTFSGRYKSIEEMYWRAKAAAPKNYHELKEYELREATKKAGISADQVALLFGEQAGQ